MIDYAAEMVAAYQDYEDNTGSKEADNFYAIFEEKRRAWREAGKPS